MARREGEITTEVVVRKQRKLSIEKSRSLAKKKDRKTNPGRGKFQEEVRAVWSNLK